MRALTCVNCEVVADEAVQGHADPPGLVESLVAGARKIGWKANPNDRAALGCRQLERRRLTRGNIGERHGAEPPFVRVLGAAAYSRGRCVRKQASIPAMVGIERWP
jgi:hypothetical protein